MRNKSLDEIQLAMPHVDFLVVIQGVLGVCTVFGSFFIHKKIEIAESDGCTAYQNMNTSDPVYLVH